MGTFEDEWPALARRVEDHLVRRNVPTRAIDDIVQETGLRLFQAWDDLDADRSPAGLAIVIARQLAWRDATAGARELLTADFPETVDAVEVEGAALARAQLAEVGRLLPTLSERHRQALLSEVGETPSPAVASYEALKMLRYRARRKLRTGFRRAVDWTAAPGLWNRLAEATRRTHGLSEGAAGVLIVLFGGLVVPGDASRDPSRREDPSRSRPALVAAATAEVRSRPRHIAAPASGRLRGAPRSHQTEGSLAPAPRDDVGKRAPFRSPPLRRHQAPHERSRRGSDRRRVGLSALPAPSTAGDVAAPMPAERRRRPVHGPLPRGLREGARRPLDHPYATVQWVACGHGLPSQAHPPNLNRFQESLQWTACSSSSAATWRST